MNSVGTAAAPRGDAHVMAPAEAGDVGTAPFWYYVDNSGAQQGPFAVAHMHSWHAAGYLLPTTKMAASYYGEVPDEFWPLSELFEASEQPFANGAAAPAPAERPIFDGQCTERYRNWPNGRRVARFASQKQPEPGAT